MRRGIIRAKNTDLSSYEVPEERQMGQPQYYGDGVVKLPTLRFYSFGVDIQKMKRLVDKLSEVVEAHAKLGAKIITWS